MALSETQVLPAPPKYPLERWEREHRRGIVRRLMLPDPYPMHPAEFRPFTHRFADEEPTHEVGVWYYGNRLHATGCRCGLAFVDDDMPNPSFHPFEWQRRLEECRRRAGAHVRSLRSRASSEADGAANVAQLPKRTAGP